MPFSFFERLMKLQWPWESKTAEVSKDAAHRAAKAGEYTKEAFEKLSDEAKGKYKQYSGEAYEQLTRTGCAAWLQDNISRMSWTNIATAYIALTVLVKMPFAIRNLLCNKGDTGRSRFIHADDKTDLMLYAPMALSTLAGLYAINSGTMTFGQLQPVNETMSKLGVVLGVLSLGSLVWIHASLGPSWSAFISVQKGHKLQTRGAYRYARHPMYINFSTYPLVVFLISQNWLLASLYLPWLFLAFKDLKREETLMIEVFGQDYVDYKKRVRAFGMLCPRDCGLTEAECAMALQMREQRAAEMDAAAKQMGAHSKEQTAAMKKGE